MAIERVAVVLNGKAGALLGDDGHGETLRQALADAGLQAEFIPPELGTLPERIAAAVAATPDAVLVAGGDGTVACAAQALANKGIPLGVLPFGTMNLLAKDLGLPIGDLPAAVRAIAGGHNRAIDVAEVNGNAFLCASMLGLPVQIGRHREASRGSTVRLWARMARAILRATARARPMRLNLGLDGTTQPLRAASVTVTVNPVDEASGRSFGRTELDGGSLCVYVVQRLALLDLLRLGVRMVFGRVRSDAAVKERLAAEVDIAPHRTAGRQRGMQVMNDGEMMLLEPPLRYRLRPGALRVLVPAP